MRNWLSQQTPKLSQEAFALSQQTQIGYPEEILAYSPFGNTRPARFTHNDFNTLRVDGMNALLYFP
jgi:hypothetical protein